MRKIGLLLLLSSMAIKAQFHVKGNIEGYYDQNVNFKVFNGSKTLDYGSTKTNGVGSFKFEFKTSYQGVVQVELDGYNPITLLADNKEIEFKSNVLELPFVEFENNKQNELYQQYLDSENGKVKIQVLEYLKKTYEPSEEFYAHIDKELTRVKSKQFQSKGEYELLDFIVKSNVNIEGFKKVKDPNNAKLAADQLINIVSNEGQYLEKTSLFGEYLMAYVNLKQSQYGGQENFTKNIKKDIDAIIDPLDIETSRGQQAVLFYLDVFKISGPNYEFMVNYLVDKTNALSCEIDEDLKHTVKVLSNIKVGGTAPDIIFTKKIKKVKKLSKIKANKKVLMFWASWCPHCVKTLPVVKQLYSTITAQGGELIAISADTDKESWELAIGNTEWINDCEFKKWSSKAFKEYGVTATPSFFVVDENMKIIGIHSEIEEVMKAHFKNK